MNPADRGERPRLVPRLCQCPQVDSSVAGSSPVRDATSPSPAVAGTIAGVIAGVVAGLIAGVMRVDRGAARGLRARGHHGVFPKEREECQTFVVDLVLGLDTRPAAAGDDLAKTVHYGVVAEEVVAVIEGE